MIKGVLLDLSGTVYIGDDIVPGAIEAINRLQNQQIPLRYLTNSSRRSCRAIVEKLHGLGLPVRAEEIFTAPQAVHAYLQKHQLTPWLLVHPALVSEFQDFPAGDPDAVVLGDAADAFTYANLNQAFRLLAAGAKLLSVGDNRYFQEKEGLSLDVGPFVAALEYAADCQALVLGKPAPEFFHAAAQGLGCAAEEILMVGDDVLSDINGALAVGMKAALVRTGKYRQGDELRINAAGACVCDDIVEALAGVGQPSGATNKG